MEWGKQDADMDKEMGWILYPFCGIWLEFSMAGNGTGKVVCSTDMCAYERKRFQDSKGRVDLWSSSLNTETYALFITCSHQAAVL